MHFTFSLCVFVLPSNLYFISHYSLLVDCILWIKKVFSSHAFQVLKWYFSFHWTHIRWKLRRRFVYVDAVLFQLQHSLPPGKSWERKAIITIDPTLVLVVVGMKMKWSDGGKVAVTILQMLHLCWRNKVECISSRKHQFHQRKTTTKHPFYTICMFWCCLGFWWWDSLSNLVHLLVTL